MKLKVLFATLIFATCFVLQAKIPKDLIAAIKKSNVKEVEKIIEFETFTLSERGLLTDFAQSIVDKRKIEFSINNNAALGFAAISAFITIPFLYIAVNTMLQTTRLAFDWPIALHNAESSEQQQRINERRLALEEQRYSMQNRPAHIPPVQNEVHEANNARAINNEPRVQTYVGQLPALSDHGQRFLFKMANCAWKWSKKAALSVPLLGISLYFFNKLQSKRYNDALTVKILLHEARLKNS